jgi:rubredoxin
VGDGRGLALIGARPQDRYSHGTREGTAMNQYQCIVCGFIYDEAVGMPDEGIPAGTRWADIPSDWQCPDCGLSKAEFEMVQI